jgi:DNA-directed RNA polymerase subunit K/omega
MTKKIAIKSAEKDVVEVQDEHAGKLNRTDSIYRGVVVACQRSKQLIKGALPRTSAEFSLKRKSTRIAVEEVKQGLIFFEIIPEELI